MEQAKKEKSISRHAWIVVFIGLLAVIGSHGFGRMAYSIILPQMTEGLGLNWTQAGLLGTANFVGYLLFALAGGYLASRYGTRRVILFSLLITALSLALTGTSSTFQTALVMRFITGMGSSGVYMPAMSLGSLWFASKRRGLATGIIGCGPGVGIFLTGVIVPPIVNTRGWATAWYTMGILVLIITCLCFIFLRDRPQESPAPPSSEENTVSSVPPEPRSLYRRKEIWHLGLVYSMYGLSHVIYSTFFYTFLNTEVGLSGAKTGAMWALAGSLSIISAAMWGIISDMLGRKWGLGLVYTFLAISYSLFFFCHSLTGYYISAIFFGLGLGSVPSIIAASVGDRVEPRLIPTAMGFVTLFFGVGQALGPAIGGYLADFSGSFRVAFAIAAFFSLVGTATSFLLIKPVLVETE
ncbi:MAG TPA: YbfB/YjiJ family MFS transporter [Firmicutes bacterium]|jgi:MFS family permease|nr:YbfB/YjiJ family MFS transporter [Bacillota bacterium]